MNVKKSISMALAKGGYSSAAEFSRLTGFPEWQITQMKKNKKTATIGSLLAISEAFGMKVSEFVALGE